MSQAWIKTEDEIERVREGGKLLAAITDKLIQAAKPGVSTGTLGKLAEELIEKAGGTPVFKGYGAAWGAPAFPAAVCISLNEEVVHGIPRDETVLQDGDLLKIDIGMRYKGMVTDMARSVPVGTLSGEKKALAETTRASLLSGIKVLRDGAKLSHYTEAVDSVVSSGGFSLVRDLVGHGVGRELHEDPQIPNYNGSKLPNFTFRRGMVVALEPMVNAGGWQVDLATDGWTFVTSDGTLSAHSEDTVLITEKGSEILTTV